MGWFVKNYQLELLNFMINPYQNLPPGVSVLDLEQPYPERGECAECGKEISEESRLCMSCWLEECGCKEDRES